MVCYSKGAMKSFPSFPVTCHLRTIIFSCCPSPKRPPPQFSPNSQTDSAAHFGASGHVTHSPLKTSPVPPPSPPPIICGTQHPSLLEPSTVKIPPDTRCFMRTLFFSAGWYEGERLRDGERGWFPMECAKEITCQATIDKNVERMGRLLGLETNV